MPALKAKPHTCFSQMRPDFIVRVRIGGHLPKSGPASLKAMGFSFMNLDGAGNIPSPERIKSWDTPWCMSWGTC